MSAHKNYSSAELARFKELVKKYAAQIEDKKTDSTTVGAQNLAWAKLTGEFNSVSTVHRLEESLRNKWKNLKKSIREDVAKEKNYVTGTGGGAAIPPSLKVSDEDEQLRAVISLSATGLDNDLDEDFISDDMVYEVAPDSDVLRFRGETSNYEKLMTIANANVENVSNSPERGAVSPTIRKRNTSNSGTKRQKAYQDKLSAWAAGKAELTELQRAAFQKKVESELHMKEEEHKMRMQFEKALYEARLQGIAEENEYERKKKELELKILARNA